MRLKFSIVFVSVLILPHLLSAGYSFAQDKIEGELFDNSLKIKKINLTVNGHKEIVPPEEFSGWLEITPILEYSDNYKTEIENIDYCSSFLICDIIKTKRDKHKIKKKSLASVKKEKISSFLESLGERINQNPIDAKFKIENNKVTTFSLSHNGFKLNTEKSVEIIAKALLKNDANVQNINLAYEILRPEISSENVNQLGINALIGKGTSDFRGSTKSRVHNIKIASARFNGTLIKPKEEFSFIDTLGEVNKKNGYLPELVIKHNKTEPAFGGGICQVSTTVFRAAIYSGLKITARRPHAYPVHYYNPQGLDATVYIPRPDLRFINNTPGYILIQTEIKGTKLAFYFYGIDDGRKIETIGPKIIQRNSDGSMKTTFTQKVYDAKKSLIINDVFNSNYDSPNKYPHPGQETKLTEKPENWSKKQWKEYKKKNY